MGKPNWNDASAPLRKPSFKHLQAPAFKHLKPTQPSPRGGGHITGSPEGVRKYLKVIHHA
jgi:hypothetical protein